MEICCHNLKYDAENILIEAAIPEVDLIIGITPDKRTKSGLESALKENSRSENRKKPESVRLLDAGQVLVDGFDWYFLLIKV